MKTVIEMAHEAGFSLYRDISAVDGSIANLERFAELVHEVYTSPPAQRKPLTLEEIDLLINGRGEPDDDDYVEPIGDGFGLTDADLVRLVRKTEAAHNIKEKS